MIDQIKYLKNIGQFEKVTPPKEALFKPFTLIYGENGQGKTTIASVLRSVSLNEPNLVLERQRLGSKELPHIVFNYEGSQTVFERGAWSRYHANIVVFGDSFISDNICSGGEVYSEQRQGLHELILGVKGVTLNNKLKGYVERIKEHNSNLRNLSKIIPVNARGPYGIEEFCKLEENKNIDAEIQSAERRLTAANSAETIRKQSGFQRITLPDFDAEKLNSVLGRILPDIESEAVEKVKMHFSKLGKDGEDWISGGMDRINSASKGLEGEVCPYCVQNLSGSQMIEHYRSYFSQSYKDLKKEIEELGKAVQDTHGGDSPSVFERNIRLAEQTRKFWEKFTEMPHIDIDTEEISKLWKNAREAVITQLRAKFRAPLEKMVLTSETIQSIHDYQNKIAEVSKLSQRLLEANKLIKEVKSRAVADNLHSLKDNLARLRAQMMRFDPSIKRDCDNYIKEKTAKIESENLRDKTRTLLDQYQKEIFSNYEDTINKFLNRFLASFRLGEVKPTYSGAGPSASYSIVINRVSVPINAKSGPNFRNTLSAGDRNTLALAFFFASLELDPDLKNKIVVFDDPMTSLDEHRKRQTCEEIISMCKRQCVKQVIVLSHSKSFLCHLWEKADMDSSTSLHVKRAKIGSELVLWNVRNDSLTDHDLRHERIREYAQVADPSKEREVATDLRPTLEAFLRVAYPEHFPPETSLGEFINKCKLKEKTENKILYSDDIKELDELRIYANEFHHDTKPDWRKTVISDIELKRFADRTLLFTSRR